MLDIKNGVLDFLYVVEKKKNLLVYRKYTDIEKRIILYGITKYEWKAYSTYILDPKLTCIMAEKASGNFYLLIVTKRFYNSLKYIRYLNKASAL